jgi:uncharacterized protein YrzB (UPF0473 family)
MKLETEDGSLVDCDIIRAFELDGQSYIVLLPTGAHADGEGFLYRFSVTPDGAPLLELPETDEEFQLASDAFNQLLNRDEPEEDFEYTE